MGIKKLYKLLEKKFPESIKIKDIKEYKGKKVAVDAYLILYQFLIAITGKDNKYFVDANGRKNGHIHIILNKTIFYLRNGILPIYVWDGIPPDIKSNTLHSRKKSKLHAKEIINNLDKNDKDYIKYLKRTVSLKNSEVNECINLLNVMGIPWIKAPGEADSQCAALAISGIVDAVVSEDMDLLTFGSPVLLKKISSKNKKIIEIRLNMILKKLCNECSYEESLDKFIDLCILLKCDYCSNIKGIGPEKALKYINKYGSIINMKKNIDNNKLNISNDYLERCKIVKNYFKKAEIIDPHQLNIIWKKPDKYKLIIILNKENNIKMMNINKFIDLTERFIK
jgi:flap endonuclease-1